MMVLNPGEKVFVLHRQMFERDARRHFFGIVESVSENLARVTGLIYVLDHATNTFTSRDLPRTRIIPLDSSGIIINVLPDDIKIERIKYEAGHAGTLRITDGTLWHLEVSLF